MHPTQQVCSTIDMFCFATLADANKGTMYTDLTGRFPVMSFKGNQYLFVAYLYDRNAIIIRPMKSRKDEDMVTAFQEIIEYLDSRNAKPTLNVMDNECSKTVKAYITKNDIGIQFVEAHNHRVNAAERAIATVKDHFIAGLATVDINCPIQLWDEFLEQTQDTLNMLRTSRREPTLSAYDDLEEPFDFNKTPLAPLGTKGLIYEDPTVRNSFAPHATDVFYVGPPKLHYRNMRFFDPTTRGFRNSGSLKLYPTHCKVPALSEDDRTIRTAHDLLRTLQLTPPPTADAQLKHCEIIERLTAILTNAPSPRVHPAEEPRVNVPSTSHNTTSPTFLRQQPRVHLRKTRANTPMPTITEDAREIPPQTNLDTESPPIQDIPAPAITCQSARLAPKTPPSVLSPINMNNNQLHHRV
jgi:hypothetical protein